MNRDMSSDIRKQVIDDSNVSSKVENKKKRMSLHFAATYGHVDVVKALI